MKLSNVTHDFGLGVYRSIYWFYYPYFSYSLQHLSSQSAKNALFNYSLNRPYSKQRHDMYESEAVSDRLTVFSMAAVKS